MWLFSVCQTVFISSVMIRIVVGLVFQDILKLHIFFFVYLYTHACSHTHICVYLCVCVYLGGGVVDYIYLISLLLFMYFF